MAQTYGHRILQNRSRRHGCDMGHLRINDGDVLVFRYSGIEAADFHLREILSHFKDRLKRSGKLRDVALIAVPRGCDISCLDEAEMNKIGWFKRETNCSK